MRVVRRGQGFLIGLVISALIKNGLKVMLIGTMYLIKRCVPQSLHVEHQSHYIDVRSSSPALVMSHIGEGV